ncbi:IS110 family transposase [Thalassotalea sp. 42_200_T64]|nr:IS110 family transposase [Thalassotalea sp. 42_200_T64]
MSLIKILGIDLGKSSFHVIGRDFNDTPIFRKKFTRQKLIEYLTQLELCTIAFEACGGAHWLGRKCQTMGHTVRLIPPQYVKPYVKGNKNDFIDAEAISEAATRPNMRFVSVKTEEAQVISSIHKIRQGYVKERTACMSRIGALLLEFGISLPRGHATMKKLFNWLASQKVNFPSTLMEELLGLHEYYLELNKRITVKDNKLRQITEQNELGRLLKTIPGIGDKTASLCIANISAAADFKNGRNMAAWLGLVPRQYSTGGKPTLLGISKRGNKALRTLFVHCARSVLSKPDKTGKVFGDWLYDLRCKKPFNVATVALANKLARIAWAVIKTKKPFDVKQLQQNLQC